jgi:hypothetical protein
VKNHRSPVPVAAAAIFLLFAGFPLFSHADSKQFVTSRQLNQNSDPVIDPAIGVADLNGDGRPDILYGSFDLLENADGTFRTVTFAQGFSSAAKIMDVNGDGKLDVVDAIPAYEVCDYHPGGDPYCDIESDAYLAVYLGNGDGTFRNAVFTLDLGECFGDPTLSVLDLNGDGKPDVTVNFSQSTKSFVLLSNGNGTYHQFGTSGLPPILASGDFNGDGKVDLACLLGWFANLVWRGRRLLYERADLQFRR